MKARSSKIVVDTSNLPGGNTGIIQYLDKTSTDSLYNVNVSVADSDLPGDNNSTWPQRKILVFFYNVNGVWSLKKGSIRFCDIKGARFTTTTTGSGAAYPDYYKGSTSAPLMAIVDRYNG